MPETLESVNQALKEEAPSFFASLSRVGRQAVFPPDIPFQAEQARGTRCNATIGQITDGHGKILALPSLAAGLASLEEVRRDQAIRYSPIAGLPDLRTAWRQRQRDSCPHPGAESSLPVVTVGLAHALSLAADLLVDAGTPVAVATPFWGNYRQTFALRCRGRLLTAPSYDGDKFNPRAVVDALASVDDDRPAVVLLNIPSNPGGYSPDPAERSLLIESLREEAEKRPLTVLCDDAYSGLVHEEGIAAHSIFWDLCGLHPRLTPVKIDGVTKELDFFGGRVGFLTFPFPVGSAASAAVESKIKCLIRASVGSPVAPSQVLVLSALQNSEVEREVAAVKSVIKKRYQVLREALAKADPERIRPLPFNSGCFALVRLPSGLGAEAVRLHLIEHQDTGVIAMAPDFLRIAYCSVASDDLPELVQRLEGGIAQSLLLDHGPA